MGSPQSPGFTGSITPPCGAWDAWYQTASFGNAQGTTRSASGWDRLRLREPVLVFALSWSCALWHLGISPMTRG